MFAAVAVLGVTLHPGNGSALPRVIGLLLLVCGGKALSVATGWSEGGCAALAALFWLTLPWVVTRRRVREVPLLIHIGAAGVLWLVIISHTAPHITN